MKKKSVKIKFLSSFPKIKDAFPEPEAISKNIPEWFKKQHSYRGNDSTPQFGKKHTTIKKCPAVFDLMTAGYVLKAPCDIYIDATGDKIVTEFSSFLAKNRLTGVHAIEQYSSLPIDDMYHKDLLRLNLIWLVQTQKGYSSIFIQPQFSDLLGVTLVPGIIDTDTFLSDGLFSFYVKKEFKGEIKKGTPLVQVIPYKRENYEAEVARDVVVHDLLDFQRYKLNTVFMGAYKKMFRSNKVYK